MSGTVGDNTARASGVIASAAVSTQSTHLKTITASDVASVEFVDGASGVVFDDTYHEYLLKVSNYWSNGTAGALEIRITNDSGVSFESSGYNTVQERAFYSGPTGGSASALTDCIWANDFSPGTSATGALSSTEITFNKPTLTAYADARGFFWGAESGQALLGMCHGRYQTSAAYDGFEIYQASGGNFSARLDFYGIKEN